MHIRIVWAIQSWLVANENGSSDCRLTWLTLPRIYCRACTGRYPLCLVTFFSFLFFSSRNQQQGNKQRNKHGKGETYPLEKKNTSELTADPVCVISLMIYRKRKRLWQVEVEETRYNHYPPWKSWKLQEPVKKSQRNEKRHALHYSLALLFLYQLVCPVSSHFPGPRSAIQGPNDLNELLYKCFTTLPRLDLTS